MRDNRPIELTIIALRIFSLVFCVVVKCQIEIRDGEKIMFALVGAVLLLFCFRFNCQTQFYCQQSTIISA